MKGVGPKKPGPYSTNLTVSSQTMVASGHSILSQEKTAGANSTAEDKPGQLSTPKHQGMGISFGTLDKMGTVNNVTQGMAGLNLGTQDKTGHISSVTQNGGKQNPMDQKSGKEAIEPPPPYRERDDDDDSPDEDLELDSRGASTGDLSMGRELMGNRPCINVDDLQAMVDALFSLRKEESGSFGRIIDALVENERLMEESGTSRAAMEGKKTRARYHIWYANRSYLLRALLLPLIVGFQEIGLEIP